MIERSPLWNRLRYREDGTCWVCISHATTHNGYPRIFYKGKTMRVCRAILIERHGLPFMSGLVSRHTCDNKSCINPDHLIHGTIQDNIRDRDTRNKTAKGENHYLRKLTEERVREIRNNPQISAGEFGRRYGIHWTTVQNVRRGKTWKHVT